MVRTPSIAFNRIPAFGHRRASRPICRVDRMA
jgi:hypothetical protein